MRANERPQKQWETALLPWDLLCSPGTQWLKRTNRHIHGHGDSMTNSAQWGRVGENITMFLKTNGKWLIIQGVKKKYVQHQAYFRPFVKVPAEKLMPHYQISFKSWLNNVESELYIFLLKSML